MLKDNLIMLRKMHGFSQEQIAKEIGISRQAYSKWENGTTTPDIDRAASLAKLYGITLDNLMGDGNGEGPTALPPPPPGKNIWGAVTIGERGQIVIPKAARDKFGFKSGDRLIVVSDEVGIALLPVQFFERMIMGPVDVPPGDQRLRRCLYDCVLSRIPYRKTKVARRWSENRPLVHSG